MHRVNVCCFSTSCHVMLLQETHCLNAISFGVSLEHQAAARVLEKVRDNILTTLVVYWLYPNGFSWDNSMLVFFEHFLTIFVY